MEPIPCVHCGLLFKPRNRRQNYCCRAVCQKARKAGWQRRKMHADAGYRAGHALTDIKNRLGHENIQSTMAYLQLDLSHKKQIQQKLIDYSRATITDDPKINELIDWENKEDILAWLNSL